MQIKEKFPDTRALQISLGSRWDSISLRIKGAIKDIEPEYRKIFQKPVPDGVTILLVGTSLLVIVGAWSESQRERDLFFFELLTLIVLLIFIPNLLRILFWRWWLFYKNYSVIHKFNTILNSVIIDEILTEFGLEGKHYSNSDFLEGNFSIKKNFLTHESSGTVGQQVVGLLDHSELFTMPMREVIVDDMVNISWSSGNLFIAEVLIRYIDTSRIRNRKQSMMCHFVSLDLSKTLTGKTFITAENDRAGYGINAEFLQVFTRNPIAKVTELEWNQFEQKLRIESDNPAEARYILNPAFMESLYDWWKDKPNEIPFTRNVGSPVMRIARQERSEHVRISFIGSRMYMLIPIYAVPVYLTVRKPDNKELQAYMMGVASDLLHVMHLVDDVELA